MHVCVLMAPVYCIHYTLLCENHSFSPSCTGVEELTGYLMDCMDQSDLYTFANEMIDDCALGTRDKLKQQILDTVVQERRTLYYVARRLLAKNTLYKYIFKITNFTNCGFISSRI